MSQRTGWLSRWLCRVGSHDWRNMDGVCRECGYRDPLWHGTNAQGGPR